MEEERTRGGGTEPPGQFEEERAMRGPLCRGAPRARGLLRVDFREFGEAGRASGE